MKKEIILAIAFVFALLGTNAQDTNTAREHIKILASKELHGRGIAYDGENKAAEYLRTQLESIGVEPLVDEYFQKYECPGFAMEGSVNMLVEGKKLVPGEDFRVAPFSISLNEELNVIFVKPDILADNKKLADFNIKYADVLPKSMVCFDDSKAKFKNEDALATYKKNSAYGVNPFQAKAVAKIMEKFPAWGLQRTSKECDYAYLYVRKGILTGKTANVELRYNNELREYSHRNVCGIIRGSEYPDRYIVLTAHYDHLGAMGEEVYFPGAHDNASGCALLLNMAQYFTNNPPKYSIVFLFFAGEESGLLGSRYFVENSPIDIASVECLFNFDLLGGGDEGVTLVNSKQGKSLELYEYLNELNEDGKFLPKIAQRENVPNSDHYFFTEKDVPALFLYTMGGKTGAYHDPSDTSENCSLTMFDNVFKLFVMFIEKY